MKIVIQRVTEASVKVDGKVVGSIDQGLLALVGIGHDDDAKTVRWAAEKTVALRIFEDDAGKMNRSVVDVGGSVLAVSQFTLLGDCRKGRRPSFIDAADPAIAKDLYEQFCEEVAKANVHVERGIFAADMKVLLTNDGPVTMILER